MAEFKVRDLRKKDQFIIDDAYLNGWAKIFGPTGTAVYLSLCRRADKGQACFPSEELIANDHNIHRNTVRKYLKLLAQAKIIKVEQTRKDDGTFRNNIYYLLDKSEWKKPIHAQQEGMVHAQLSDDPCTNERVIHAQQMCNKELREEKDAHIKVFLTDSAGEKTQTFIGEWIGLYKQRPMAQLIGQVSKQVKLAVEEGQQDEGIRYALMRIHSGLSPSCFPSLVAEHTEGGGYEKNRSYGSARHGQTTSAGVKPPAGKYDAYS